MDLKYVIPQVKETFGTLTFGSEVSENREGGRNGKVVSRTYELFSNLQRADNIQVTIPVSAGDKKASIEVEARVKLVNPRVAAIGYRIGDQAFVDYTCNADNIVEY